MNFKDKSTSLCSQKVKLSHYDMNYFNMMIKWSLTEEKYFLMSGHFSYLTLFKSPVLTKNAYIFKKD